MGPGHHDELASLKDELLVQLRPFGQEHLVQFWDELSQLEKMSLATQIAQIDFDLIVRLARSASELDIHHQRVSQAEPPPAFRLGNRVGSAEAIQRGEQSLRAGQIAAVLVAGGQGTRLGFDHPKGMYPIGPVSGASLFQILFEKLIAMRRRYGQPIPLMVMTSPATHEETLDYFDATGRFGLPEEDLIVITQATTPAVDAKTLRLLLSDKGSLHLSPDGHGGLLSAMRASRAFEKLFARNVEHLFYFQVDNPLAKVCDPEFLGCHLLSGSEASTLAVAKKDALDKVGNIVAIDGRLHIIEYSEFNQLSRALIDQREQDGRLRLWAGNTAIHVFDLSFLDRVSRQADQMPYHVASKIVPHLDEHADWIEPDEPNALKFERFIFDLLPLARHAIAVEADERESFAPVKNSPGEPQDSPETARAQMLALYGRWLGEAGFRIPPTVPVEISPLFALDAEELKSRLPAGTKLEAPTYLK